MVNGVLQAKEAYLYYGVCVFRRASLQQQKKLKCNYSEIYTVPQAVHAAFFALQFASVVLH
jgi:hypothetical protein